MTNTKKTKTKKKQQTIVVYPGAVWFARDILARDCPHCGARALTELPPALKAKQPDDTVIVCNPGFGGCNQGFAV